MSTQQLDKAGQRLKTLFGVLRAIADNSFLSAMLEGSDIPQTQKSLYRTQKTLENDLTAAADLGIESSYDQEIQDFAAAVDKLWSDFNSLQREWIIGQASSLLASLKKASQAAGSKLNTNTKLRSMAITASQDLNAILNANGTPLKQLSGMLTDANNEVVPIIEQLEALNVTA